MLTDYFSARMPALDVTQAALIKATQRRVVKRGVNLLMEPSDVGFVPMDEIGLATSPTSPARGRTPGRSVLSFSGISLPSENLRDRVISSSAAYHYKAFVVE